jgi:nucleotide-binding universal stress UspA family protein
MYRHILVPTDGTKLSRKAIDAAVRLAQALGARITGAYVIPPYQASFYADALMYAPPVSRERYRALTKREGQKALAEVSGAARAAGVPCGAALLSANQPWEGVLQAAKAKKCDLIVMASHGRRGLAGLLLGSETTKVLTHSRIPVLVCR